MDLSNATEISVWSFYTALLFSMSTVLSIPQCVPPVLHRNTLHDPLLSLIILYICFVKLLYNYRPQWPDGLRQGSTDRLRELQV